MKNAKYIVLAAALSVAGCSGTSPSNVGMPAGAAGLSSGGSNGGQPAGAGTGGNVGRAGDTNHGGSSSGSGGSQADAGAAGAGVDGCGIEDFSGITVFASGGWDPLGYPPYALDGCTLVYVAPSEPGATSGALYRRDLVTGREVLLETAALRPRRPAVAGDLVAWEVDVDGKSQVRVRYGNETRDITGDFDHAGEPRVAPDAVVLTGFLGATPEADSDVFVYDPVADKLVPVAVNKSQQRFADISRDYVALTDFTEDPQGYFNEMASVADVVLVDRATGNVTTRQREGKQAFPLLGSDGTLVYLDWGAVHPEPKFSQFSLRGGNVATAVTTDVDLKGEPVYTNPAYVRPSLRGKMVDFVDSRNGSIGLYHVTVGTGAPPLLTPIAGSPQLFGPVAGDSFTLVSQPLSGPTLALTAVSR